MGDLFEFAEERHEQEETSFQTWKVLVVDDDLSIHDITKSALKHIIIEGRKLDLIFADSANEAKKRFDEHDNIALALVDVVMETRTAGLDLVNYIRNDLKNDFIRLIIRTGQPDEVPERGVIDNYDINDYKEKTELTVDKLYTVIRSGIKQYTQLVELSNKYEDVYRQMTTHPLTSLPNRQKLNEALDTDGEKNLLLLNIDNFSEINSTQGFDVGDDLLQQVGAFLTNMYSDEMNVYHLEGDTFGILSTDGHISEDRLVCIKTEMNKMGFYLGDIENHLSITMGFVMHEEGNLIQKAEFALKEARSHGKNCLRKYSKDIQIIKTIRDNSLWTKRIQEALKEERLVGYMQPIFDISTGKLVKYECLVRMRFEDRIIGPFEFLDAARSSGQMYSIFKLMFDFACKKSKEFSGQFTVNMTDMDLKELELLDFIDQTFAKYDVNPAQIGIELLEQNSIMNDTKIKDNVTKLSDKGISIIIDDFGSECSNFGQLVNLPISLLKIDGSFIRDLDTNAKHRIVVESIIEFSTKMNVDVVAEFVHSKEILEIIKKMGVKYGQGFYLAEPSPEFLQA